MESCESNRSSLQTIIRCRVKPARILTDSAGSVRIRELSKLRRHSEALAAAETLALKEPQNRDALYLVAANQRCLNQITEALTTLERLEQQHPGFSLLFQERGSLLHDPG